MYRDTYIFMYRYEKGEMERMLIKNKNANKTNEKDQANEEKLSAKIYPIRYWSAL